MSASIQPANTDFETRSLDAICVNTSELNHPVWYLVKYLLTGIVFGIILTKAEVISWFRIQEMFRFESFHMYGVIGSAVAVGMISVWLIKKFSIKTIYGEEIALPEKPFNKGQVFGGCLFGFGWAMTGACPGPLYALLGTGSSVMLVMILSAIGGTLCYGLIREKLPH